MTHFVCSIHRFFCNARRCTLLVHNESTLARLWKTCKLAILLWQDQLCMVLGKFDIHYHQPRVKIAQIQGFAARSNRSAARPDQPLSRRHCPCHMCWHRNGARPVHQSQAGQSIGRPFHLSLTVRRFKGAMVGPKPALVSLYPDGSVLVTAGGTEMGQGLFTKAKQVRAFVWPFAHIHLIHQSNLLCLLS